MLRITIPCLVCSFYPFYASSIYLYLCVDHDPLHGYHSYVSSCFYFVLFLFFSHVLLLDSLGACLNRDVYLNHDVDLKHGACLSLYVYLYHDVYFNPGVYLCLDVYLILYVYFNPGVGLFPYRFLFHYSYLYPCVYPSICVFPLLIRYPYSLSWLLDYSLFSLFSPFSFWSPCVCHCPFLFPDHVSLRLLFLTWRPC